MGKWTDTLFGTSEERKKKHRWHEQRKNALQEQKENNKKMRTLYRERNKEEIRLRQMKNTENKDKSLVYRNQSRWYAMEEIMQKLKKNNEIKKQ